MERRVQELREQKAELRCIPSSPVVEKEIQKINRKIKKVTGDRERPKVQIKTRANKRAMDELIKELESNGFAKNNPNCRLCVVYGNTVQDGQYSAEARQAAERLQKFLPTYGQWTIEQIKNNVQ